MDPVGACVGTGGSRVKNVVDELFGEKIDITTWDEDPKILIKNVLSPAKVEEVIIDEEEKTATVVVPDYQLSLAIGKSGQNVRLAARLCGWKIDIKSHSQYFGDPEDEELLEDEYMEDDIEYVDDEDGIEYIGDDEDEIEYIDDEDDQDMNEEITEIPEDIEDMEDIGDDGEITETAEDRGDEIED